MDTLLINIGAAEFLGVIFTITASLIGVAWRVGGRIGRIETLVASINTNFDEMKNGFEKTVDNIKVDVDNLKYEAFKNNSPVQLTTKGKGLLEKSGFKKYIDEQKDQLLEFCKNNFKLDTAYDIQEAVFDYFDRLEIAPDYEREIKEYAYKDGASMEIIRRVGGIYFRDICLEHFKKDLINIPLRETAHNRKKSNTN